MTRKPETRLSLMLDQAQRALERSASARGARWGLGNTPSRPTTPTTLRDLLNPLVHNPRSRGLGGAVDPTTIATIGRFEAVARELSRMDPLTLVLRLRQRGRTLRGAPYPVPDAEDDHDR